MRTLEKIEDRKQILEMTGLDWTVRTEGVKSESGIILPNNIALIRDDNDKPLGVQGKDYVPFQNHELLDLLFRIGNQTGLNLHTGGSFGGGERVWFQLKSGSVRIGDDKVQGYISGFNSFDGTTSLAFGNSNLTISCQNSFFKGYKSVVSRIRHSGFMTERIEMILKEMDLVLQEEKGTFKKIKRMSEVRMTPQVREMVKRMFFELDKEEKVDTEYSTRKKNQLIKFDMTLDGEIKEKGDNLWGLFSGVTKYTTHEMKKTDNTEAKIFGMAGRKERLIWDELSVLV